MSFDYKTVFAWLRYCARLSMRLLSCFEHLLILLISKQGKSQSTTIKMDAMNNSRGILSEVRRDNLTAQFQEPRGVKFARIVIEILISVFGVFGNTLVCMAISRNKRLQNIGNIFIFNLSIADLGVLLMCLPLFILNADLNFSWPFGDMGCKLLLPLTDIFYGVSIGSIVAISFHRYRLIVHCMDHQMSARKAKLIVAFIWVSVRHFTRMSVITFALWIWDDRYWTDLKKTCMMSSEIF